MRPLLSRWLIIFLAILIVLMSIFFWIGCTNQGLKSVAATAEFLIPGLRIKGISGTISGPLNISRLELKTPDIHVVVKGLFLEWQPLTLFQGKMDIDTLDIAGIDISKKKEDETKSTESKIDLKGVFSLPIDLELKKAKIINLSWRQYKAEAILLKDIATTLSVEDGKLYLKNFTCSSKNLPLSIKARGFFDSLTSGLPLRLYGQIMYGDRKKGGPLSASLTAKGDMKRLAVSIKTRGWIRGEIRGNIFSALSDPSWQASWDIKEADLSHLNKEIPVSLLGLKGNSRGRPRSFDLRLSAMVSSSKIPVKDFVLSATSQNDTVKLTNLTLHGLSGEIVAKGTLSTERAYKWDMSAVLKGIDPSSTWPKWKGKLYGNIASKGYFADGIRPKAEIYLNKIYGTLNKKQLHATGALLIDGNRYTISRFEIKSGSSTATVSGHVDGRLANIRGHLKSPDLSDIVPGITGSIDIEGAITGVLKAPGLYLRCTAQKVHASTFSLDQIEANLKAETGMTGNLFARIKAQGMKVADFDLGHINIRLDGTAKDNSLKADIFGGLVKGRLLIKKGHLEGLNRYSGKITHLLVAFRKERWKMIAPASFLFSRERSFLKTLCLRELKGQSEICLYFQAENQGKMETRLQVSRFDIGELSRIIANNFRVTGQVSGTLDLRKESSQGINGSFHLDTPQDIQLSWQVASETRKINLGGNIAGTIGKKGLTSKLHISIRETGTLIGDIELPGWSYPHTAYKDQPLKADIRIDLNQLGFIEAFVPQIAQLKGSAHANISLSGSTSKIKIGGNARLTGLAFEIPVLDLSLLADEIKVWSHDGQIRFAGLVHSGAGELTISGLIKKATDIWQTDMVLSGKDFLISNTPQLKASVSPDVYLKIEKDNLFLTGKIEVPEANIIPEGFEKDALKPSPDLVIEGAGHKAEKKDLNIHANVKIIFGRHVSFDGFGLKGKLRGQIQVIEEPGQPILADGALFIKDATFNLYGTDLKLTKGRFLYSSTPIDNPELELEAIRQTEDVTAGFRIRGTIKEPVLTLFSQPSLPESEILSYLVGGGGQVSRSKSGAAIAGAANILASRFKQFLGLEDLRVKSGHTAKDISILIGTYLTPKLYVQFINDIGKNMTTLQLKYSLTKRIEIQSETGDNPSADIFLKFER